MVTEADKANNYTCMVTLNVIVSPTQRDSFSYSGNFYFAPGTDRVECIKTVTEAALASARLFQYRSYSIQFFYMDKTFL